VTIATKHLGTLVEKIFLNVVAEGQVRLIQSLAQEGKESPLEISSGIWLHRAL
jgi:hypothetical protein